MAGDSTPVSLEIALEQRCEKTRKPKGSVLFRRGEKATGIYVVLSGKVSLDLGFDTAFARSYGSGALLGLPATLTKRDYSMTATVTEDAKLGFCSARSLDLLLQKRPELCQQLLAILAERMADNQRLVNAMLDKDKEPLERSGMV
jgi:CRP-like cAMP-binding protein